MAAALALVLLVALPGFAARRKTRSCTASKAAHTTAVHTAHPTKTGVRSRSSRTRSKGASKAARRARAAQPRQTWRTGQMFPAPERYKEIQEALVAKGYSTQTPDGIWGPQWADTLKRFQQDQKLEPTGKLNSLSLITLGLGPRRESNGSVAPPPPVANGSSEPVMRDLP